MFEASEICMCQATNKDKKLILFFPPKKWGHFCGFDALSFSNIGTLLNNINLVSLCVLVLAFLWILWLLHNTLSFVNESKILGVSNVTMAPELFMVMQPPKYSWFIVKCILTQFWKCHFLYGSKRKLYLSDMKAES